jgi:hypothetical protein
MGCNCKAANHITRVKERFGYKKPTIQNVSVANKIKMVLQAILIWVILILCFPICIVILVFSKIFKKDLRIFKKIKIRL